MWVMMGEIDTNSVSPDTVLLLKCVFGALMVYFPIVGVSGILMILGSIRRKSDYVFPWLALAFAGLVSAISCYIASLVYSALTTPVGYVFGVVALLATVAALQIYFWLIVYSLYKDLLAQEYGYQTDVNKKSLIKSTDPNRGV